MEVDMAEKRYGRRRGRGSFCGNGGRWGTECRGIFFLVCLAWNFVLCGGNVLQNAGFEELGPGTKERWKANLLQGWNVVLASGSEKCDARIVDSAFSGKHALELLTLGKSGFNSARHEKIIPVRPGQTVKAGVFLRGRGTGYLRVYYYDGSGKRTGKYYMTGRKAEADQWKKLETKFCVPENVYGLVYALETLRDNAAVCFDEAFLEIEPGPEISNNALRVKLNPRVGGGIDALILKGTQLDFTNANRKSSAGGMMMTIIPDTRMPGIARNQPFQLEIVIPDKKIRMTQLQETGEWSGLKIIKEYEIAEKKPEVKVGLTLQNQGKKTLQVTQRIQNFINSEPGVYSWPTPDWLQIFEQPDQQQSGANSVVNDLLRAGWVAKYYRMQGVTLLFDFDVRAVRQSYAYITSSRSTLEWYYRKVELPPGASWKTHCRISVLTGQKEYFADAIGKLHKVQEVKLVKLPAPPSREELPQQFDGFFPFAASLGNLVLPEMAGGGSEYSRLFAATGLRLTRLFADSYFNSVYSGRLIYGTMHKPFWNPDGTHQLGEMLRRYDMRFFLETLLLDKGDMDVAEYMRRKWPEMRKRMTDPDLTRFIGRYQDRIPLMFTADEIQPQNVDVMLRAHSELKKILPEHIIPFPYLNSSMVQYLPYVPVFVGDWYPVKRPDISGRNPWSVYEEFLQKVKLAGEVPVWFMPQGFGSAGSLDSAGAGGVIYGLPSAGEVRLMLHSAVAAGVKGICWHGFANGTWPWMMNYRMYPYSLLGGAGQRSPAWEGVVDCARDFAAVGPLLLKSRPDKVPEKIQLRCGTYRDSQEFYNGPAIRVFALKTPKGILLAAVNQNPVSAESGSLDGLPGKVFDLTAFSFLQNTSVPLNLKPGGAQYFYLGDDTGEIALCCRGRFEREKVRYRIAAERASANGIPVDSLQKLSHLPPEQALSALFQEQKILQERIHASDLGRVLEHLEAIRQMLDDIDFRFSTHIDLLVTPEMRKNTPRYQRWSKHPDPEIQALRECIARDFMQFYSLSDSLDMGEKAAALLAPSAKLRRQMEQDHQKVTAVLKKYHSRIKVDNPFL